MAYNITRKRHREPRWCHYHQRGDGGSEMPATTTSNSTTVQLPRLDFDALRVIVASIQAERPAEHARIGRGLQVLLGSQITETSTFGVFRVQSCADSSVHYL